MTTATIHRRATNRINRLFAEAATITWPRRPRIETTIAARRRIWCAHGAQWRVVESRLLFGDVAPRVTAEHFAIVNGLCGWDVMSHHRTVRAAMRAAELAARRR